jgi:putative ABC transport system permease protein
MYARLLIESLRRGTRRKLLAVSAVALGTLGATALGEVVLASGDRLAAEMGSYGANLVMTPERPRDTLAVADLVKVRRIFWRNNIAAISPTLDLRVRMQPGSPQGTQEIVAPLVGAWFDHSLEAGFRTGLPRTRPTLSVAGRWPREGELEAAVGRRLAERLGLQPGGELRAALSSGEERLRVVGIVTSGGEEDDQAFAPLEAVERLAALPGRFTRAEVFALTVPESRNKQPDPQRMSPADYETWFCTAYPSSIALQLKQAVTGARVDVVYAVTQATADVLGRLRWVLTALAVVALVGAAVGVTAAMTATVIERRLEAGLLVAIGAPRGRVVLFFLSEAALLGLLGGLTGGGLGLVGGRLLGSGALGVSVPWMPILLPFAALLGLAVAVAASAAPVARALERYPAEILKRATA